MTQIAVGHDTVRTEGKDISVGDTVTFYTGYAVVAGHGTVTEVRERSYVVRWADFDEMFRDKWEHHIDGEHVEVSVNAIAKGTHTK